MENQIRASTPATSSTNVMAALLETEMTARWAVVVVVAPGELVVVASCAPAGAVKVHDTASHPSAINATSVRRFIETPQSPFRSQKELQSRAIDIELIESRHHATTCRQSRCGR